MCAYMNGAGQRRLAGTTTKRLMTSIKNTLAAVAMAALMPFAATAQTAGGTAGINMKANWKRLATRLDGDFLTSAEALRIGDNVLFYQHPSGGWPKNTRMQDSLTANDKAAIERMKTEERYATIDNGATTTEIRFLSRLYNATGIDRYREAVERGFGYLLKAQYSNGGWPQFFPLSAGYYSHVTYNDDAMVNVLKVMRDASLGKAPFTFLSDSLRAEAKASLDKGVECIIRTQVVQDGHPTVWCAQYDEHTLQPAPARAYELVSLSGLESDGIVMFLMSLPHPSQAVIDCVDNAVKWFKANKIIGKRFETYINAEGKRDRRIVDCPQDDAPCDPLWARFYTIEDNRPFFCDRDGVMKFSLSEIGYERRNGYRWFGSDCQKMLDKYAEWRKNVGK